MTLSFEETVEGELKILRGRLAELNAIIRGFEELQRFQGSQLDSALDQLTEMHGRVTAAERKVARLVERGDPMASRLAAAQKERPHRVVETSPLAGGTVGPPPREVIDYPATDNRLSQQRDVLLDSREAETSDPRFSQQQADFDVPPPTPVQQPAAPRVAKPLRIKKGDAIEARAQEFKERGAPEGNKTFGGPAVEPPVEMPPEPNEDGGKE